MTVMRSMVSVNVHHQGLTHLDGGLLDDDVGMSAKFSKKLKGPRSGRSVHYTYCHGVRADCTAAAGLKVTLPL